MRFAIGTSVEALTELDEFTVPIPEPNHEYAPYAETITIGDGSEFGLGLPQAAWVFALLEYSEQYNQLKAFCPGASASVYICTPDDSDTFTIYQATLVWPKIKKPENNWSVNLVIEFRDLVEVEVS
jgi:hypothetical protein